MARSRKDNHQWSTSDNLLALYYHKYNYSYMSVQSRSAQGRDPWCYFWRMQWIQNLPEVNTITAISEYNMDREFRTGPDNFCGQESTRNKHGHFEKRTNGSGAARNNHDIICINLISQSMSPTSWKLVRFNPGEIKNVIKHNSRSTETLNLQYVI